MWSGGAGLWGNDYYDEDPDAFVFNLDKKYRPNNNMHAIINWNKGGIGFGSNILAVAKNPINSLNSGVCKTGKDRFYDIEGEESPLTG